MIDRSKVKKMYVWDADPACKEARYVIDTFNNGSCLVVAEMSEKRFEDGEQYTTLNYLHYKEISSEKYRPFKVKETTEEFFDYLFKNKESGIIHRVEAIDADSEVSNVYIYNSWISVKDLYDDYKMKKPIWQMVNAYMYKTYTDWMPAGVKE